MSFWDTLNNIVKENWAGDFLDKYKEPEKKPKQVFKVGEGLNEEAAQKAHEIVRQPAMPEVKIDYPSAQKNVKDFWNKFTAREEAVPVRRAFEKEPVMTKAPPIVTSLGQLGFSILEAIPKAGATFYGEVLAPDRKTGEVDIGINAKRLGYENEKYTTAAQEFKNKVDAGENPWIAGLDVVSNKTLDVAFGAQLFANLTKYITKKLVTGAGDRVLAKQTIDAFENNQKQLFQSTKNLPIEQREKVLADLINARNQAEKILAKEGAPTILDKARLGIAEYTEIASRQTPLGEGFVERFIEPDLKPSPTKLTPVPIAGELPGMRERPGQAPGVGLSLKEMESVGGIGGKPLGEIVKKEPVYYHGTNNGEEIVKQGFNLSKLGDNSGYKGIMGNGIYLDMTPNAEGAKLYGKDILEVKPKSGLKLFEWSGEVSDLYHEKTGYGTPEKITEYLQSQGYDGVKLGNQQMVIFNPKNIEKVSISEKGTGELSQIKPTTQEISEVKPHLKYDSTGRPLAYTAREQAIVDKQNIPFLPSKKEDEIVVKSLLKQEISPLKYVSEDTANIFREWNSDNIKSKELANQTYQSIKIKNDGMDLIHEYQKSGQPQEIKSIFDDLYNKARINGIDVPYRQNYIPQVYKESSKQIQDAIVKYLKDNGISDEQTMDYINGLNPLPDDVANRLKLSPSFEKERVFANYEIAKKYGLHPRFKTVAEHAAYYTKELNKVIANKKLLENLKTKGLLKISGAAPSNWDVVNPEFSGRELYKAPSNVAKVINNIFPKSKETLYSKIVQPIGEISGIIQNISLSGGGPLTNVNFFALGQLIKEIHAGNLKAVNSFLKTNNKSATVEFFNEHSQTIMDMAGQGIDLTLRLGSFKEKTLRGLIEDRSFIKAVGLSMDKVFGEKTFQGFLPMMQIQLFEDIQGLAIKKGLSTEEANKLAGNVVKNNFGIVSDEFARSQATKDTLKAVFFAPRFRQSIINSLWNTGKAGVDFIKQMGGLRGKLNPSLSRNRRLLAGMILSFILYNYFNKKNTGHYMWENPENRTFDVAIPLKNGDIMYIPFMPSYLAFARNMFQGIIYLSTGKFKESTQKFSSLLSMPLKITGEIYSNKDYFGNKIYDDNDSGLIKAKKIALYTGLQVNHPYVKEMVNYLQDKKPLYQAIVGMLELSAKFSSQEKEEINRIFELKDEQTKRSKELAEEAQEKHEELKKMDRTEANKIVSEIKKNDPDLYDKLKTIIDSEKKNLSKTETYLKLLSPEFRALYIYEQAEKLKTREEKNTYIRDLKNKKVITSDTMDELKILIKNGDQ